MDKREAQIMRWWTATDGRAAELNAFYREYFTNADEMLPGHYPIPARIAVRMDVCPVCDGRGSYVNPSIDAHGISAEQMAELGDEFAEDYRSGLYNIPCELCRGSNVVPVPMNNRIREMLRELAEEMLDALADDLAQTNAETRAGC